MTTAMVDSQQTVITRTVLPLAKSKERTGYQLQPTSMHVNHHGMLPAAALSNFFKAPATPIHSKLPSINISDGKPVYRNKSMHQRNKCLAEVIQTQLVELKRLQDKYRSQKLESRTIKLNQHKDSVEDISRSPTKSNTSSNTEQKDESVCILETPKVTPKRQLIKPTIIDRSKPSSSNLHQTPSDDLQKTVKPKAAPQAKVEFIRRETSKLTDSPLATFRLKSRQTTQRNCFMDSEKLASITSWVKAVETAQRLEGKCSEVISTSFDRS